MTRRSSCGCVWERTDPDTYDGECAVGDTCDATTPAFADEGAMWRHVWEQGWTTVASLPAHYCPMCKGAAA